MDFLATAMARGSRWIDAVPPLPMRTHAGAIPVQHHRFFRGGRFLEQAPCIDEQVEACRGRLRPPPDALDQPDAEPLFEPLHLQADGRLRQAFFVGGSCKASRSATLTKVAS